MLIQLVKKDFIHLVVSLRIMVVFLVLFALFLPMSNISFACMMPAFICYIGVYSALAYEERNKTTVLNATLPVSRQEICLAKYIQSVLMIVITGIISLIGVLISVKSQVYRADLLSNGGLLSIILVMFGSGMIYSSLVLPIIFHFGTIKAKYILMIMYIIIFVIGSNLNNNQIMQGLTWLTKVGNGLVGVMGVIITIILFGISYLISLRIWEHKEF